MLLVFEVEVCVAINLLVGSFGEGSISISEHQLESLDEVGESLGSQLGVFCKSLLDPIPCFDTGVECFLELLDLLLDMFHLISGSSQNGETVVLLQLCFDAFTIFF